MEDLVAINAKTEEERNNYEIVWYEKEDTDADMGSIAAPAVTTTAPTKQTWYVSQRTKTQPIVESKRVPVSVTTIGVKEPTVTTPVEYCKNEKAEALTATKFEISDSYYYADGFMWKGPEDADYSATAPTPGTAAAGEAVYSVYQTYEVKGKLGTVIQTCEGEPVNITVKVYETEAPKEATVQYIKADASGNTFPAITQATTGAWKPEEGFEYYYSAISEDKAKPDESTYTTTVPVPTYDVSSLGGGTKELYCWVYRISEANGKACASEAVMITIKISDALPPSADNAYVCEGDAFPVLSAKANILEGSGKSADDYEIRWYENDPSAQSNPTPDGTGNTYDPKVSKALADGSKKKEYYRYVTQYDKTTDAESSPTKVTITVWPKPVWKLTGDEDPEATCEEPVDLSKAGSVTNTEDCSTPISYKYQFGEEVVEATTSITGLYNVIPSYDLPNAENIIYASEKTCEGEPVEVNVRVDSLTVLDIFGTTSVCPSEEGVGLTAKIDSSKTKPLTGLTYKWTGSQEGSGAAIVLEKFSNVKDTKYNYTVTVSTGVCEKSSKEHIIKVGEGVKEGTLTATEENNSDINSDETEDGGKAVFENGENCEIYTCGGEVTLTADFKKDENSQYEWYEIKDNKASLVESGATFKIPASDVASAKVYTLKYVNKCDVSIDIIVHNIPITVNFTEKDETLCEGKSFTKEIEVTCDETPAIQWYRDGKEISGANQQVYTKSGIKEDIDEGVYSFKVSNRGCVVKDTVGELDVQRYIKVEPKTDPYIVIRGDRADMTVKITVPEDQDVAYVGWAEDSRDTVNKVKDYTIAAVDKNHDYTIELKDPDYCPATTTIQLLVDAKLQLKATLSDTLCLGTGDDLVLDTTGTGAFYDKTIQHSLTVERMMGGSKQDITGDFQSKDGKLVHNAQPTENATYRVLYTYGTQKIDTTLRVVVIPSISLDVPEAQTVCEGEEVELAVSNVQPDGTTVSWQTDPTIKSPMDDTLKITAQPTYNAATGANHQGEYTYVAIAYNEFCGKSEKFEVKVKVDEPLTGEITGTERMCEGESGRIDASQYAASQYVWTANGEEIGTSPSMSVKPTETTVYSLEMTRGKCSASDEFTLEVTSIPVILSVDSIDVRTREIITDEGKGTRPFTYWVDKESAKTKEPIIYDLAFSKHVAYVKDDNGCQTKFEFLMEPPAIFIPEYFTPNGDGINDTWEIGNLTEVYPNAHIQIFDRFGKLLVDMTGEENSWDGTYNGHKLPSTDYWYVIDIEEIDMQYNGHFTLIRQ
jgi:gliding motility-associated-like protein